jgi:hypothetical protein
MTNSTNSQGYWVVLFAIALVVFGGLCFALHAIVTGMIRGIMM